MIDDTLEDVVGAEMSADFVKFNDFNNKKQDQEVDPFTERLLSTNIEQA